MIKKLPRHLNESFIALAAMTGCFLFLLSRTWMKWGDLIVDTFRDFWVPMKILEGHVLYRDIFYEYGFLPPYFQALLFKLFGLHLYTLAGLGIVITLLVAAAIYLISSMFLSAFVAALTVIVFFMVFAFNHYASNNNFNFILPYSFASTFFLFFALSAIYFFLRFIKSATRLTLFGWALCLSMAMFCRVELPLLLWGVFLITGAFYAVKIRKKLDIRFWLILFFPVVAGVAGYSLFATTFDAWSGFQESIIDHILYFRNETFQELIMGTDNAAVSLKHIGQSTLFTILIFPLLGAAAAGIARSIKAPFSPPLILLLILSIIGLSLTFILARFYLESVQYRCLLPLLATGVLYYACRFFKGVDTAYQLQMFCLFLSALLIASRVLLNMGPELYGFYLVVPGLICYHIVIFQIMSPFLVRCFPVIPKLFLEAVYICLLLLLALGWWNQSDELYKLRTAKMVTEKGAFRWFDDEQTRGVFQIVTWLRQNTLPEATVVVFPEGVSINIFSNRKNPLKYLNFMPSVMKFIGDNKLIITLAEHDVDYVVIVGRDASDYGYPFFGVHYAKKLFDWIQENYRLEHVIGARPFETELFGVAVYRKIR